MANSKNNIKYKVYIVEDNVLYARVLKKQLLNDNYQVKVFHNGTDFIESLHEKPDVITLDYTLPDMTGQDVLKRIQTGLPSAHVIQCNLHYHYKTVKPIDGIHRLQINIP